MSLDYESIKEMLNGFDADSKALKKSLFKLCWYMRGGMSLDEAWSIGYQERELINEMVKDNLDVTSESGLPFF